MIKDIYKNQVSLLLNVLPDVDKAGVFSMHGGTAINLFKRELPRLSVDIDLTFNEIKDRKETLIEINDSLLQIKSSIESRIPHAKITHKIDQTKLIVSTPEASIKIEVNSVGRGLLDGSQRLALCEKAQEEFDIYCDFPIVSDAQLFGGKICAALDRQHPRDLFDIHLMIKNNELNESLKMGIIYALLNSPKPLNELLNPNRQNQSQAFENQFIGMSSTPFSYEQYVDTREELIKNVNEMMTYSDKNFFLNFYQLEPDWSDYDFSQFPSIQWKMKNLEILLKKNPEKHQKYISDIEDALGQTRGLGG